MGRKDSDKYIEYEDGTRVQLDADDSPEWTEEMFKRAKRGREALEESFGKENANLLIKGKVGRPVSDSPKKQITVRIDADILKEFRSHGKGWQTEINAALRSYIEGNRPD